MTRQEMYGIIVEKGWKDEIKKKYGKPYTSCSDVDLAAFIMEKQGSKNDTDEQSATKKDENSTKPKKTQEELLQDILARVDNYKASTQELRNNTAKLESYTNLLEQVKKHDTFILTTSENYSTFQNPNKEEKEYLLKKEYIKVKFEDSEFVRELLICIITERINKLMDTIEKTQKQMKAA